MDDFIKGVFAIFHRAEFVKGLRGRRIDRYACPKGGVCDGVKVLVDKIAICGDADVDIVRVEVVYKVRYIRS